MTDKEYLKLVGSRIRALRDESGLSAKEFAGTVNLARATLYRIESGEYSAKIDLLRRIATQHNIELCKLVKEK